MPNKSTHIPIGEIYREHGVKGYCKFYLYNGVPDEVHFDLEFILESDKDEKKVIIEDIKPLGKYELIKFNVFSSPEELQNWRKAILWVNKNDLDLDEDIIYDHEWPGYRVFDPKQNELCQIIKVEHNPLKQFVVKVGGEEKFIPVVEDWIIEVDDKNKNIVMDLPEGLL